MKSATAAYVALALTPGIGRSRMTRLLYAFGSADRVLKSNFAQLKSVKGISSAAATAIHQRDARDGERVLLKLEELGGWVLLPSETSFPDSLRVIPDPPMVLFGIGDPRLLQKEACSVVGSRNMTSYGRRVTRDICRALAGNRVIVSGMARGIDAEAHLAALNEGGESVGVLGNGLGVVYPAANRSLYRRMAEEGCLITEYPPGERPNAGSFPRRNRLIAGLSSAVIVVEAGVRSGAMITVDCALAQGSDVFAVPGPLDAPMSEGANLLIRQGANPVLNISELLADLGVEEDARSLAPPRDGVMASVLDSMGKGSKTVHEISSATGLDPAQILTALTGLELLGRVRSTSPDTYQSA